MAKLSLQVMTQSGAVLGVSRDGVAAWYNIPFAAPPVGVYRFLDPQPCANWPSVYRSQRYGPACPQLPPAAELAQDPVLSEFSEDCLSLNIFSPEQTDSPRPVMVWIHGGGFTQGAGSGGIYRVTDLAEKGNLVLVTINYRLGPLGFLRLNELTEGAIPSTGNQAIADQIAALQWVKDNIAQFGGDPGRVTVFGESAGAMSVASLLASPATKGLFSAAISQSGSAEVFQTPKSATEVARSVLTEAFAPQPLPENPQELASALREMPVQALLDATAKHRYSLEQRREGVPARLSMPAAPVADGALIPHDPLAAIAAGSARDVDLTAGFNTDEWTFFAAFEPSLWQMEEKGSAALMAIWAGEAAQDLYARTAKTLQATGRLHHPGAVHARAFGDHVFRWPTQRLLDAQVLGGGRARGYRFDWHSPLADGILGACHALDLPFVFGGRSRRGLSAFAGLGEDADRLQEAMQSAWCDIAHSRHTMLGGTVPWPSWQLANHPGVSQPVAEFGTAGQETGTIHQLEAILDEPTEASASQS